MKIPIKEYISMIWMTRLLRSSFAHMAKMGPPGNERSCGPGCTGWLEDDCPNMKLTREQVRKELENAGQAE